LKGVRRSSKIRLGQCRSWSTRQSHHRGCPKPLSEGFGKAGRVPQFGSAGFVPAVWGGFSLAVDAGMPADAAQWGSSFCQGGICHICKAARTSTEQIRPTFCRRVWKLNFHFLLNVGRLFRLCLCDGRCFGWWRARIGCNSAKIGLGSSRPPVASASEWSGT
jgi:hypothetical protein